MLCLRLWWTRFSHSVSTPNDGPCPPLIPHSGHELGGIGPQAGATCATPDRARRRAKAPVTRPAAKDVATVRGMSSPNRRSVVGLERLWEGGGALACGPVPAARDRATGRSVDGVVLERAGLTEDRATGRRMDNRDVQDTMNEYTPAYDPGGDAILALWPR